MAKPGDGIDYVALPKISLEEIWETSKQVVEALLRLHGLDEAPDDCAHVYYDELDRILRMLGLLDSMVCPLDISEGQEVSA